MKSIFLYTALFMGVILEGELAILGGGIAAQKGSVSIFMVWLVAYIATVVSDWGYFFLGRFTSPQILRNLKLLKENYITRHQIMEKYPFLIIFMYRYLYGLRIVTLIYLGLTKFPVKRFLVLSLVSILLWTTIFTLISFHLGEYILGLVQIYDLNGVTFVFFLGITVLMIIIIRKVVMMLAHLRNEN